MTSTDMPTPREGDDQAYLMALFAELGNAAEAGDGDRAVQVLQHLAAEVGPEFAERVADALIQAGLKTLSERVAAGDPEAVGTLRRLFPAKR